MTEPRVDPEFRDLIPVLATQERQQLERNLVADGCRDPLVVWRGLLVDGHNRLEICTRRNLSYAVVDLVAEERAEVKEWIIRNQLGRRNLQPFQIAELILKLKPLIAAKAKENQKLSKGPGVKGSQKSDDLSDTKHELAKLSGLSHDTIHKAEVISGQGTEEAKARLNRGETTIHHEYQLLKKAERKEGVVGEIRASAPLGKFHVIVIDPPWPMQKIERDVAPNQSGFEYPTLTIGEITDYSFDGRSIVDISADHAHMFMWTTQKFLPDALTILKVWDFRYVCTMVWHKPGGFQPYGLPQYNCEFVLYARRGTPSFQDTKDFFCCFEAPRKEHSRKPDSFYEVVRRVTLEPRIDVFSREVHEGFTQLGNEIEKYA